MRDGITGRGEGRRVWWIERPREEERIAIRASLNVRRARRIGASVHRCAHARAVCASRILKTYTSDGKSGVKYKSVMPPKNSVGAEPPVFRPPPTCSSPSFRPSPYVIPLCQNRVAFLSLFLSSSSPFSITMCSLNAHCVFSDAPPAHR